MNYLELKNVPKKDFSTRLSQEMIRRLDMFTKYQEPTRLGKIAYLARLYNAVNPDPSTIEITQEMLEPKTRWKRGGTAFPEDVTEIIRKVAKTHNIGLITALDLIVVYGIRFSKSYSLEVTLTKLK